MCAIKHKCWHTIWDKIRRPVRDSSRENSEMRDRDRGEILRPMSLGGRY